MRFVHQTLWAHAQPCPTRSLEWSWAASHLTHVWVMLVLLWKAFTSRESKMAETCSGGSRKALGEGRMTPAWRKVEEWAWWPSPKGCSGFWLICWGRGTWPRLQPSSCSWCFLPLGLWICWTPTDPMGGHTEAWAPLPRCPVCQCAPCSEPIPSSDIQCC